MPGVVKAHLDALNGIAYDDDRRVKHLVVHRYAWDHPWLADLRKFDEQPSGTTPNVFIVVGLLEAYTRLYDRMFRREIFRRDSSSPMRRNWTARDEVSHSWKTGQGEINPVAAEQRLLERQAFADIDRPGPLSDDMRRAFMVLPAHRVQQVLRRPPGGTFLLDLPGQEPGSSKQWVASTDAIMERERKRGSTPRGALSSFVALDIAVRGDSLHGKDLDNLAHAVIERFEPIFCVHRGTVSGYRVYSAVGGPTGVQVRVVSESQMLQLEIALGDTRAAMLDRLAELEDSSHSPDDT